MSVEPPPGEGPLISVVVTTYALDRLKEVKELLDNVPAQSYPNCAPLVNKEGELGPPALWHVTAQMTPHLLRDER
jgi:hypothetical protein